MEQNRYRRAIGIITLIAALIGLGFAIPGTIEFMQANALWATQPDAGSWYFDHSRWWFGAAFVGLLTWLATNAILGAPKRKN